MGWGGPERPADPGYRRSSLARSPGVTADAPEGRVPAMRRPLIAVLVVLAALMSGSVARAATPETIVTGNASSKWYQGSLIQQYGLNCSTAVLGEPYSEVMTNGYSSYGGTNGVVGVGDQFWVSLTIGIPGNPCGSGSAGIQTDLFLPPGVQLDGSRGVRCFGVPRNSTNWVELTGGDWTYSPTIKGKYCENQLGALSASSFRVGFRVLASGQLFQVFVPVKATQVLTGAPGQVFDWQVTSTAAYANPALTRSSAFVFNVSGVTPSVFFSRAPSAIPYWNPDAPAGQQSRVEFFANLNTAGYGGKFFYEIYRTDTNPAQMIWSTDPNRPPGVPGEGAPDVPAGESVVQIIPNPALPPDQLKIVTGPNGGLSPLYFSQAAWNLPMKVIWRFRTTGGALYSGAEQPFRILAGPDTDGDGVPDATDKCPSAKGSGADGCTPVAVTDDADLDGVKGASDACPSVAAPGTPDGCPATAPTPTPVPTPGSTGGPAPSGDTPGAPAAPTPPVALLAAKPKSSLAKAKLAGKSGAPVSASCTAGASATFTLTATKPTAKALGLKTNPLPVLATATAPCGASGAAATLKLAKRAASKARASKRPLTATLSVVASGAGGTSVRSSVLVTLR